VGNTTALTWYRCRPVIPTAANQPGSLRNVFVALRYWQRRRHDLSGGKDGVVYQKDLGKDTATQALSMVEYNPDKFWTAVQVP